jgi:hypothetical protein
LAYELEGSGDPDACGSVDPEAAGDPDAAGDAASDGTADGAADGDGAPDAAGVEADGAAADGAADDGARVGPKVQPAPLWLAPVLHAWVTTAAIANEARAASRGRLDMDGCMRKAYRRVRDERAPLSTTALIPPDRAPTMRS